MMKGYENSHAEINRPRSIVIPSSNTVIDNPTSTAGSSKSAHKVDDPLKWNNEQVLNWLGNSNESDEIVEMFKYHNITGVVLPYLGTQELLEMGIKELRQRLSLKKTIADLLINSSTVGASDGTGYMNNSNGARSLVISNELITAVSNRLVSTINSRLDTKKLNDQFNKLREDLLPIVKELKDKKPLPLPLPTSSSSSSSNTTSFPSSAYSTLPGNDPNASPIKLSNHQSQLQSSIQPQKITRKLPNSASYSSLNQKKSTTSLLSATSSSSTLDSPFNSTTYADLKNNSGSNVSTPTLPLLNGSGSSGNLRSPVHATLDPSKKPPMSHSSSGSNINNVPHRSNSKYRSSKSFGSSGGTPGSGSGNPVMGTPNSNEPLKQLRAKTDDPCYKTLQAAMRRHNLSPNDWKKFALVILYGGDQERVIGYEEKPVLIFKELSELGLNPSIMLRQIEDVDDDYFHNNHRNLNHDVYNDDDEAIQTPGGRL